MPTNQKSYDKLETFFNTPNQTGQPNELIDSSNILIRTLNEYSQLSARFIKVAYDNDILRHLFCFLKNEKILNWLVGQSKSKNETRCELITLVMDALVNLCRLIPVDSSYKGKWKGVDAVQTLQAKSEVFAMFKEDDCHFLMCIVLAIIANEEEINNLKGIFC